MNNAKYHDLGNKPFKNGYKPYFIFVGFQYLVKLESCLAIFLIQIYVDHNYTISNKHIT